MFFAAAPVAACGLVLTQYICTFQHCSGSSRTSMSRIACFRKFLSWLSKVHELYSRKDPMDHLSCGDSENLSLIRIVITMKYTFACGKQLVDAVNGKRFSSIRCPGKLMQNSYFEIRRFVPPQPTSTCSVRPCLIPYQP